MNRPALLATLALALTTLLLAGCTAYRGVRLCGIRSLSPTNECVLAFYGDVRTGQITSHGGVLVPRGSMPSAAPVKPAWQEEIDKRCAAVALRQQQERLAAHPGEHVPYAPLEAKCRRAERAERAKRYLGLPARAQ